MKNFCKIFLPPLIACLTLSFLMIIIILCSILIFDSNITDFEASTVMAMTFFILLMGYPISFISHIFGLFLVGFLKKYGFYKPAILFIFGFVIGILSAVIFISMSRKIDIYHISIIVACGFSGLSASITYYFLDRKISNNKQS